MSSSSLAKLDHTIATMAAATSESTLSKVDSLVEGKEEKKTRRASSKVADVYTMEELREYCHELAALAA